jgi:hypothetical protein
MTIIRCVQDQGVFSRLKEFPNKPHDVVTWLCDVFNAEQYKIMEKLGKGVRGIKLSFSNIPVLSCIYVCNDGGRPELCKSAASLSPPMTHIEA